MRPSAMPEAEGRGTSLADVVAEGRAFASSVREEAARREHERSSRETPREHEPEPEFKSFD